MQVVITMKSCLTHGHKELLEFSCYQSNLINLINNLFTCTDAAVKSVTPNMRKSSDSRNSTA